MKKLLIILGLATSFSVSAAPTDDQIKQNIIQQSIASYPGTCACPYSTARNGSQCGGRSAYSKPGGHDPICYPADVTPQMIQNYKRQNNIVENLPVPESDLSPSQKAQNEIAKTKEYNRIFGLQLQSVAVGSSDYTRIINSMAQNNRYIKQQEDIISDHNRRESNLRALQLSASSSRPIGAPTGWINIPGTNTYRELTAMVYSTSGPDRAEVWAWTQEQGYIKIIVGCSYDYYRIEKDSKEIVNNPYNPGHPFWTIKKAFCY